MNFKTTKLSVITTKEILDDSWDIKDESVYVAYELLMAHFDEYMKGLDDYPQFSDTTLYEPTKANLFQHFYYYLNNTLDKVNLHQSMKLEHAEKDDEYIYESKCSIRSYEYDKGKVYTAEHEEQLAQKRKWKEKHEAQEKAEIKERQRLMRIKEQAEEEAYERFRKEQMEQEQEIQSMFVHPRFSK